MTKKFLAALLSLVLLTLTLTTGLGSTVSAASAAIDSYITINSVTKNSSTGSVSVNYTMKQNFNPNPLGYSQYLSISYNMPYLSISSTQQVQNTAGTYTMTFGAPTNYVGTQVFSVNYGTTSYTETKEVGRVFNAPTTTTYAYHQLTTTEAVAGWAWQFAIPGLALKFFPVDKILKVAAAASAGWALYAGFTGSANIPMGLPQPVSGQYYKTTSWYSNFKMYSTVQVWTSLTAYNHGDLPVYTGTSSIDMP